MAAGSVGSHSLFVLGVPWTFCCFSRRFGYRLIYHLKANQIPKFFVKRFACSLLTILRFCADSFLAYLFTHLPAFVSMLLANHVFPGLQIVWGVDASRAEAMCSQSFGRPAFAFKANAYSKSKMWNGTLSIWMGAAHSRASVTIPCEREMKTVANGRKIGCFLAAKKAAHAPKCTCL